MLDNKTTTQPHNMPIKAYRKMKLKMLKDFHIFLNDNELARFHSLATEIEIDNFCITMIKERL